MAAHSLKRVQKIPVTVDEAWDFFSNPANLQAITPAELKFHILSLQGDKMFAGQVIEYRVRPFLGIPFYWMTEISEVKEKEYFVDVQRKGPYAVWEHHHYFKEIPGGVEMTDVVQYKNPLRIVGKLANRLFVKKKLQKIFDYRAEKIEELFGRWNKD